MMQVPRLRLRAPTDAARGACISEVHVGHPVRAGVAHLGPELTRTVFAAPERLRTV